MTKAIKIWTISGAIYDKDKNKLSVAPAQTETLQYFAFRDMLKMWFDDVNVREIYDMVESSPEKQIRIADAIITPYSLSVYKEDTQAMFTITSSYIDLD